MQRQRQQKRAAPLTVSVNDATGCQTMPISWDASTGKAPWTVMIAPVNQVPYTMSVASASGSNFVVNWSVPQLRDDAPTLIAVADSTGAVSGVSSLINLKAATGSCAAISDGLDFVWYPTKEKSPGQCDDWSITWQQDKDNNGVQGQVTYTFLPEKGQPVTTVAGTGDKGSFKWAVPFDQGTKFLAIGNDGGKAGTGGVGDLYSVSNAGRSKTCKAVGMFGNGLPAPSAALNGAAPSTTAASKNGKTSAAGNASATRKSGTQATSTSASDASSTAEKHNTAGTAVGATFGVLGALALIGVLVWWWRRRRNSEGRQAWGGISEGSKQSSHGGDIGYPVSPWRWSTSPYEPPQTTSRASKWLSRASGSAAAAAASNFRVLSRPDAHGRSGSITTAAQPNMQQAAFRNMSVPDDDYALSNMSSVDAPPQHRVGVGAQSVHSTVPDAALFPPPPPPQLRNMPVYDEAGYRSASRQNQSSQSQYQNQSPFADPPSANRYPPMDNALSEVRQGTSLSSPSYANGSESNRYLPPTGGAANRNNEYIGPIGPTKTSIYDPYTHMSQVYDDSDGSMADRIEQAGAGSHDMIGGRSPYAHPAATVSSEVMMPTDRDRFASHFAKTGPSSARKPVAAELNDDDDDDDGLPYL